MSASGIARWVLLLATALLGSGLVLEVAGLGYYGWQRGELYYLADAAPEPAAAPERPIQATGLHPYYGFAIRPGTASARFWQPGQAAALREGDGGRRGGPSWERANNLGFFSEWDYPVDAPGAYLVGVFGGSVAHSFVVQSGERLASQLGEIEALAGREIRILNFGSGGYKQPQQLIILAHLLQLGQRLDFVTSLDGFNEVALGGLNPEKGLDPSMPSAIHMRSLAVMAAPASDLASMRYRVTLDDLASRIRELGREQAGTRSAGRWMVAELRRGAAVEQRKALAGTPPPPAASTSPLVLTAPIHAAGSADAEAMAQRTVGDWARSVRLMAALARDAGARHLQVLQPNQYVGAHVFGPEESARALNPASPFAPHARAGYPLLRRAGAELDASGIPFLDATALFDEVEEPVYADDCCHYNQRGNDLLADLVARAMTEVLAREPESRPAASDG